MRKILTLCVALFLAGAAPAETASAAPEAAPVVLEEKTDSPLAAFVDLDLELTFYSAYIWRGQIMFDTAVWQPAGNVWLKPGEAAEYGKIKLRAWSNFAINGYKGPHRFGGMSIVDETVSYNYTAFDCLDVETGFILYQFPNRHASGMRETDEFLAGVRWRNPYLTPRAYVWWDFDSNGHNDENMLYFDFDFSHAFALTDALTLTLGSGFGVANGSYMDHYSKGDVNGVAFNNFHSDLGLSYQLTEWLKVGGSLSYCYSLSRQVRHSRYDLHDHYNAGILRGGIHLVANF